MKGSGAILARWFVDGRGDPQRVAGCRSGSALRCRTLRTHSRPAGHPGRELRTVAAHGSGRSKPQGSEASAPDLRDGHHRALPPARELGRGGAGRDVSGWISVRRVEDITEALWGTRVSPST